MQNTTKLLWVFAILSCRQLSPSLWADASAGLEPWVAKCTILSGDGFKEMDARKVAGGVSMQRHGKWGWSPQVQSAEGVLALHPISGSRPGEVRFKISPLESKGKKFVIMARGSEVEPGVAVKITARGKTLKEAALNRAWVKLEVPIADLPASTAEVIVEVSAIGGDHEYCYIDFLEIR